MMAQPNVQLATPPEVPLAVTLTFAEWQQVFRFVARGPFDEVAQLIDKLNRHVSQRVQEFHETQQKEAG
jgi:hypothetical protein